MLFAPRTLPSVAADAAPAGLVEGGGLEGLKAVVVGGRGGEKEVCFWKAW